MSSDFKNIALQFFHGTKLGFDLKSHQLIPLDARVDSVFHGAGVASSISCDDVSNIPLIHRFIQDLSQEMDQMELASSSSAELVCQAHRLASRLLKLDAYAAHRDQITLFEQKTAFYAYLHEQYLDPELSELIRSLYQPKMCETDAAQIAEALSVIPSMKRGELVDCVKKFITPEYTAVEVQSLLTALSDPVIIEHASKWAAIAYALKWQNASAADICIALEAFKDDKIALISESVASFMPPSCSDEEKRSILLAFSWTEKPALASKVSAIIKHHFSSETNKEDLRGVLSDLNRINKIDDLTQIENLLNGLISPTMGAYKKSVILNVLIQASLVNKVADIADIFSQLSIDKMNTMNISILASILEKSKLDFAENLQFAKALERLIVGAQDFAVFSLLNTLNKKEYAPYFKEICYGINQLLDKEFSEKVVMEFINRMSYELGTISFRLLIDEILKLDLKNTSGKELTLLSQLIVDEFQVSGHFNLVNNLLRYSLEGMSMDQINQIAAVLSTNSSIDKADFIAATKDFIRKDMTPETIAWSFSVLSQSILLGRYDEIKKTAVELLSPTDHVVAVASMMNILNGFPKDANFGFLIEQLNRFNIPKISADPMNQILHLYQGLPESTWAYYTTKIQEIKDVCRTSEELADFAEDVVPDKKTLAQLAIYLSGSSFTLKTGDSIDVDFGYTSKALGSFDSLLNEVESDFIKKAPAVMSEAQRNLVEALKKTRKDIRDSFIINQELKKLAGVNRETQSGKIAADVMAKLSADETVIVPYNLMHTSASGDYSGHSVSLEINKQSDGRFNITVYNTGFGINHHKNIPGTSKYYPVVIKDIPDTAMNPDQLKKLFMEYNRFSSLSLEDQFNAFYTSIKSLGIQDDESARAYNQQGDIGNCSVKCLTKMMHDRLGADYEFVKTLMHQKLYNQMILTARSPPSSYDIKTSPDFAPFIKELQDRYAVPADDIEGLLGHDESLRSASLDNILALVASKGESVAFSLVRLVNAAKVISLIGTATASTPKAVQFLIPFMKHLKPEPGDKASDVYLLVAAEFLKKEILNTSKKVDFSKYGEFAT